MNPKSVNKKCKNRNTDSKINFSLKDGTPFSLFKNNRHFFVKKALEKKSGEGQFAHDNII